MRVSTRSDKPSTQGSFMSNARPLCGLFAVALTAIIFLWALMLSAADDAAAQGMRGGLSTRGGGGFERGAFGRGAPRGLDRPGPRFGRDGAVRRPEALSPFARTPGGQWLDRAGRPGRLGTSPAGRLRDRQSGKRQTAKPDHGKPSTGHLRRSSAAKGDGHNRLSSAGGTHKRAASGGHHRNASVGEKHDRRISAGGDGHNRRISAGEGHRRVVSAGDGHSRSGSHYRRGSSGRHDRRISLNRVPPPPIIPVPPVVIHEPPPISPTPPAPPARPSTASGGGGGQPPRSASTPSGTPPQRVSRAFGGPPPSGEDRYVPDEVICVLRDDLTEAEIDQFLADNRLERTPNGRIHMGLIGVQVFRYRITDGRSVPQAIAELQNDPRGVSVQPNYLYQLSDMTAREVPSAPSAQTSSGLAKPSAYSAMQYAVAKLRLREAHQVSRGERVLVAVIDSGVDIDHPEFAGSVVKQIDVTDAEDASPHIHGTAMTGAILSRSQLMGVAPGARVIAIRAFAPRSAGGAHGTSFHIALAIDRAAKEGARVINLSLAGPNDPYVHKAIAEARVRGIVLVAAAGNAGPTSPPLYPAAYPEVIAVTATDSQDRIYDRANRGAHVTIAAPGVDVLVVHPRGAYGVTSGTSVAAAHISGIVALMLSRNPMLDPDAVQEALVGSVRPASAGAADEYGAGHADAYAAAMAAGPGESGSPVASTPAPMPTGFSPARQ